ncbi:MAG: protein kinase [Myxococcota bacterium]|nr:protein kinase [Myxococcota bacterium]
MNHETVGVSSPSPLPGEQEPDRYIGQMVDDRYVVLRKLGQGGMGVVYLAEHSLIERRVALKILSSELAGSAEARRRFIMEGRAAARIHHRNIVDVYDFGQVDDSVYIAMEYLEGQDLAQLIRQESPLPAERVRHIMLQIVRGLAAAHAQGIVHRDLKPENIFVVEREGEKDVVKIMDFGVAKLLEGSPGRTDRLTRAGFVVGTPEYMAPEQASGSGMDHRVDIYALGCILYEMLTGTPPFVSERLGDVMSMHLFTAPVPPSQRVSFPVAPDLEAVCLRALEKDPARRFQSMEELLRALDPTQASGSLSVAGGQPAAVPLPAGGLPVALPGPEPAARAPIPPATMPAGGLPHPIAAPQPGLPSPPPPMFALPPEVAPQVVVGSASPLAAMSLPTGLPAAVPPTVQGMTPYPGMTQAPPERPAVPSRSPALWLLVIALPLAVLVPPMVLGLHYVRAPRPASPLAAAPPQAQTRAAPAAALAPVDRVAPPPAPPATPPGAATPAQPVATAGTTARIVIRQGTPGALVLLNDRQKLGRVPLNIALPLLSDMPREIGRLVVRHPGCVALWQDVELVPGGQVEVEAHLRCRGAGPPLAHAAPKTDPARPGTERPLRQRRAPLPQRPAPPTAPPQPDDTSQLRNPFAP